MYNTAYNTQPMKIFPVNYIFLFTIGIAIFSILVLSDNVWGQTSSPLITSSRGFFNTTNGGTLHNTITSLPNASSTFNPEANECPNEIAIYIHGVWTSEEDAKELALASARVRPHVEGRELKKSVYVPGRLVNLLVG